MSDVQGISVTIEGGATDKMSPLPVWSRLPELKATLPVVNIQDDIDIESITASCIKQLETLEAANFTPDALWRDSFALTGTMRTFYGAQSIVSAWKEVSTARKAGRFSGIPNSSRIMRAGEKSSWVHTGFKFENSATPATSCSGFLSLVPDETGGWKIWMLRTILEQLQGHGDVDKLAPVSTLTNGTTNGVNGSAGPKHFDCVVVGAGQSGLSLGGRLKALGVSYVVVDTIAEVGDSWAQRYESAKLHTTREYAHLPFERTFTPDYPEWLTKDDLAKGYKVWVKKFGINLWLSTKLESGSWDQKTATWKLKLNRHGEEQDLSASHIAFAIGAGSQFPLMPKYPNQLDFKGTVVHSVNYKSAYAWKGKRGIVVGSANTGHDVAEDMLEAGLSPVTMVQRNRTYVLPAEYFKTISDGLYNTAIPTELADRIQFSGPTAVGRLMINDNLHSRAREQPERFDALERAGFKLERYGEITHYINERLGGHYMDVGASAKIAKGLIKMKSDSPISHYTNDGLCFSDGTEIAADVIVFATGFLGNLRQVIGTILGPEVESQIENFWGLDPEGELYGAFKPTGHPALWMLGGTIGHARYMPRFVALQVKADILGTPLPIYNKTPSNPQ